MYTLFCNNNIIFLTYCQKKPTIYSNFIIKSLALLIKKNAMYPNIYKTVVIILKKIIYILMSKNQQI